MTKLNSRRKVRAISFSFPAGFWEQCFFHNLFILKPADQPRRHEDPKLRGKALPNWECRQMFHLRGERSFPFQSADLRDFVPWWFIPTAESRVKTRFCSSKVPSLSCRQTSMAGCFPEECCLSRVQRSGTARPHSTRMILVIEDEEDVRDLVEAVLSTRNIVLTSGSLEEAEVLWREKKDEIKLVLSDLRLSGKTETPKTLAVWQKEKPGLHVVYMSGMISDSEETGVRLVEGINFLPKPFTTAELLKMASRISAGRETAGRIPA